MSAASLIAVSKNALTSLFDRWHSRYRYTIDFQKQSKDGCILYFLTTWCQVPTKREPIPAFRVEVRFKLVYPPEEKRETANVLPVITYQVDHEEMVFECDLATTKNLDVHILRMLNFKKRIAALYPIELEVHAPLSSSPVLVLFRVSSFPSATCRFSHHGGFCLFVLNAAG